MQQKPDQSKRVAWNNATAAIEMPLEVLPYKYFVISVASCRPIEIGEIPALAEVYVANTQRVAGNGNTILATHSGQQKYVYETVIE